MRARLSCGLLIGVLLLIAYRGSFSGAFVSDDIQEVANKELIRSLDWDHVRTSFSYLSFSEHPRTSTYIGLLGLFVLAILSKMNTLVLPAVCLAYEGAFRFRMRTRDILASIPMFALGGFVAWYNVHGNPIHGGDYWGGGAVVTWLSSTTVVFWYLGNVLWPGRLRTFYDVPLYGSPFDLPVLLSIVGLAAMALAVVYCWRTRRPSGFWFLWFGIALAPMLNIVPFRSMMNDRYMYLPMVAPLVLMTTTIDAFARSARQRAMISVIAAAAIVGCMRVSDARVQVWSNVFALWQDQVEGNYIIGGGPGARPPDFENKLAFLRARAASAPWASTVRNGLGALYLQNGQIAEATEELEAAMRLAPEAPVVALNLGRAYAYGGRLAEAHTTLEQASVFDPYSFITRIWVARMCRARGDLDGAQAAHEAAARISPELFNQSAYWQPERAYLDQLQARPRGSAGR